MKKTIFFLALLLGFAFAQYAEIIDNTNTVKNVDSSAAYKVYVDTLGDNPDFGLRLCDVGQKYVAAVYSADLGGGSYKYIVVSKDLTTGSSNTLVNTTQTHNATCYYTPIDAFAFSQFRDFTRTPIVHVSAFPGRIHAMYSNSADGSSPTFLAMYEPRGYLRGDYSVTRSFTQGPNTVSADINSITFQTDLGSITRNPNDADWGLSSTTGRSILVALCDDDIGDDCSDAVIVNDSGDLPVTLDPGEPAYNDQNAYDKNVVVNGIAFPICIGADISPSITVNPAAQYSGGDVDVNITVTNNGNVGVTTNFVLYVNITGPAGYFTSQQWTITENLAAGGGSTFRNFTWPSPAQSGTYTVNAHADRNDDLDECNKGNNRASRNIQIAPVYMLHTYIDGVENNTFPEWGWPYNLTLYVNSTDGTPINTTLLIYEVNGLNPFIPTQIWNNSGNLHGIGAFTRARVDSNDSGYAMLNIIPTCNKVYSTYPGVDTYVGNYSMYIEVYERGNLNNQLNILYNGTIVTQYPLLVNDTSCNDPGWRNDKKLVNADTYVLDVYDWIYEVYSIMKKLVKP